MESIVQQTLLVAQQKGKQRFLLEELQAFLALNIAMGLLRLPRIAHYWSKCHILSTPFFHQSCLMTAFLKFFAIYI